MEDILNNDLNRYTLAYKYKTYSFILLQNRYIKKPRFREYEVWIFLPAI